MRDKKKIIHFTHWTRNGITGLIDTISTTSGSDYDFGLILLTKDNDFENYYEKISKKIELDFNGSPIQAIKKYLSFIQEQKPDIIHTHSFTPFILATLFSPSIKKILHLHSEYPYFYLKNLKSYIKRALLKICVSFSQATIVTVSELAAETAEKVLTHKAYYIPNGLPDKGRPRPDFLTRPNGYKFYSVSRLDRAKNIQIAIQIIVALKKIGFDVTYDIYGDGIEKHALTDLIIKNDASSFIDLKGFHDRPQDIPEAYDFYLTTTIQEGLSLSALDAMKGKTPLITTAVGQIGRILKHNHNGFIIGNNFETSLLAIEEILLMPNKELSKIQINGRNLYLEKFTENIFLKKIFNLYKDIL
jgi:glycosyltransferase involved in cell wall biosynthesis